MGVFSNLNSDKKTSQGGVFQQIMASAQADTPDIFNTSDHPELQPYLENQSDPAIVRDASPNTTQVPETTQRFRTDLPGGILNPVNDINRFRNTKAGTFIDEIAQAAGRSIGLSPEQMSPEAKTGNKVADTTADVLGNVASLAVIPGTGTQNLVSATYNNPATQRLAQMAGSRIANPLGQKVAQEATREAIAGGAIGAASPVLQGDTNAGDIASSAALNAGIGAVAGAAAPVIGAGVRKALESLRNRGGSPAVEELLALPAPRPLTLREGPLPSGETIAAPGNVTPLALPEPNVLPPTRARAASNPYRVKFENLIAEANKRNLMPGRELEELDSLWSSMAGPEDPGLMELIDRAYPSRNITSDLVSKAKENQRLRETYGVGLPVRTTADRYQPVVGNAAAPSERVGIVRPQKTVQSEPAAAARAPKEEVLPETTAPTSSGPEPTVVSEPPEAKLVDAEKQFNEYRDSLFQRNPKAKNIFDLDLSEEEFQKLLELKQQRDQAYNAAQPGAQSMNLAAAGSEDAQAYAGNLIPFRQAPTQTERTISRNQIVKNLRKNIGVVIDSGRLPEGHRGAAGVFKIAPEVVRSGMAEDIQVISHEVGHFLDKKFNLRDPQYQRELNNLLIQNGTLNLSAYQPHQLHEEGVAEFVRLYLTDPQQAERLAPNFSKYFLSKLPEDIRKGLDASQKDIDTWITQGEYEQAKGLIDFESGSKKEKLGKDKLYTRYLDDLNPLKLAEEALSGSVQTGSKSIYKMARLSRGIAERAKMAITRGIYDANGNKVSDGLAQIVKPLEDMGVKEEDFATYLAVKHAIDLKAMGKNVPFTDEQINAVLRKLDTPEIRDVQQKVIEFNNRLLDVLVDAQILSQKAVNDMRVKYPNYVPFMRYFDDDAVAGYKNGGYGSAKGFANITNPVKRMSEEGSHRTIINPIESMVKNTFLVMNAAAKNKVGLQLADLAQIDGAGAWVEHVGEGGASSHEHIVAVWANGVKQQYKVRDPELYNAMLSLDTESTNSLIKFLGGAASLLRAGATLTPEFLIRNAFRDVAGAMLNSTKYGFNPLDFFKGLFHVMAKTETFDQFISSGGAMGTMMALDRDANREAMKAIFKLSMKDKAMNVVTSPKELAKMLSGYTPAKTIVGGLRKAAEVSELSTKVGVFNKVLNKTGDIQEAAYSARDLMDFNRAGSAIRQANRAVAFLNAGLQGTDKMFRAYKDNRASFLTRAFTTLVLPSIGLYYYNKNLPPKMKQEFDNIPQWEKDTFYIIGIPGVGFARIPKPFEAGMLFATGTDRVMRWVEANDPQAFNEYGKSLLETFTPPLLMTAFTPLLEAITNHSFFRDAPIIPMGEQRIEKKDQYGLYTSETSKLIGQGLSHVPFLADSNFASPRIIDNTIKGYTAGLGQYGIAGTDAVINAVSSKDRIPLPAKKPTEQPFARSFFANTAGGGQVRQDFYDRWDKLSSQKSSADKNNIPFVSPEYERLKVAKSYIDKLNKQYKAIQKSKKMTPVDKRAKLDEMDKKMNSIASRAMYGK